MSEHGCTCGSSGALDGHAYDCALRDPFAEYFDRSAGELEAEYAERDPVVCPECGSEGPHTLLGTLGTKTYARCRACGSPLTL